MKKYFFILLALIVSISLTGCGSKNNEGQEDKNPTSIPSELQGLYKGSVYSKESNGIVYYHIYKVEKNTVKTKICSIGNFGGGVTKTAADCEFDDGKTGLFSTTTYSVKDITLKSDNENINFNIYDEDNELYAKCITSFGRISCDTHNGHYLSWNKES